MSKSRPLIDVLVLGSHPSCYLAAALLEEAGVHAAHATIPGEVHTDRLVLINPKFFDLHKLTGALKKLPTLAPVHGLKFLADDGTTSSEYIAKEIAGYIGRSEAIRQAMIDAARKAKIEMIETKSLEIVAPDESGMDVILNGVKHRPKMLLVGGDLPAAQRRMLGLPEQWDAGVIHRYTYCRLKGVKWFDASVNPTMPMSLDLGGQLRWAWLLPGVDEVQIAVEQPIDSLQKLPPAKLLAKWMDVLSRHKVLKTTGRPIDLEKESQFIDMPLFGALQQEGVANRTLLIGPAGDSSPPAPKKSTPPAGAPFSQLKWPKARSSRSTCKMRWGRIEKPGDRPSGITFAARRRTCDSCCHWSIVIQS